MVTEEKKRVRSEIRKSIAEIPALRWKEGSEAVSSALVEWLNAHPEIKKVALFSALPTEIDLRMATLLSPNIEWHYPVVSKTALTFHRVTDHKTLATGYAGILEPNPQVHPPIITETLDLIICPGLAFTKDGDRLGRGGGFYDRFLSTIPKAKRLGVCLSEQITPSLPVEDHDIPMTHLLTSDGLEEMITLHGNLA